MNAFVSIESGILNFAIFTRENSCYLPRSTSLNGFHVKLRLIIMILAILAATNLSACMGDPGTRVSGEANPPFLRAFERYDQFEPDDTGCLKKANLSYTSRHFEHFLTCLTRYYARQHDCDEKLHIWFLENGFSCETGTCVASVLQFWTKNPHQYSNYLILVRINENQCISSVKSATTGYKAGHVGGLFDGFLDADLRLRRMTEPEPND